jgi:GNAT superfamily N-acetyltransferase
MKYVGGSADSSSSRSGSGRSCATASLPLVVRRFSPGDSLSELTFLVHRAFANLGAQGLNCTGVDQSVAATAERIARGSCYVALINARIAGTVTLHRTDPFAQSAWLRGPRVASLHQLAVDPNVHGLGLGSALLRVAEGWARAYDYQELALYMPAPAEHLLAFYATRGYRRVETIFLPGKRYASAVLSRRLAAPLASARAM